MDQVERLIEQLNKDRTAMQRALSRLDVGTEVCPGWTIKEVLAHISGWDAVGTSIVRAHLAGEQPPPLGVRGIDAYNAYLVAGCETMTYEEIVEDWRRARKQFVYALTETPQEKLRDRIQFPWGEMGNIPRLVSILSEHEREHAREIMELASTGAGDPAEVGEETE